VAATGRDRTKRGQVSALQRVDAFRRETFPFLHCSSGLFQRPCLPATPGCGPSNCHAPGSKPRNPNAEDAERGLRDGLISRAVHDAIVKASKRKATPPQNTPLGGDIYIHGNGASSDWTWGCVALENEDIGNSSTLYRSEHL
jgi:hypothetical protein